MSKQHLSQDFSLAELEMQLQGLSHDTQAIEIVRQFAEGLGKTQERQRVFNLPGALVRPPILHNDALNQGLVNEKEDIFQLLQGDIVSTDAGYFLGDRILNGKYAVLNSTCDIVPQRRQYAALLRIIPITPANPNAKELLAQLLRFKSTQRMYLPPLPKDASEVLGNVIDFDGVVQIRQSDLLLATRQASLSLVGWRIFASQVRAIFARTGESEVRLRRTIQ